MRRAWPAIVAVLLLGALAGCGDSSEETAASSSEVLDFRVSTVDGWVRATRGTGDPSMTGAFMTLQNDGERQVTLTGASSPIAGMTQLHEMVRQDGEMTMQEMPGGLEIPAGRGQMLMPGGDHVMLMGLKEELAAGDEVELTLQFATGDTIDLTLPVKEFTEEEPHYHDKDSAHDSKDSGDSGKE